MKIKKENQVVQTIKTKDMVITKHAQQRCKERGINEENLKSALGNVVVKHVSVKDGEKRLIVKTRNTGRDIEVCVGLTKGKNPKHVVVSAWETDKSKKEMKPRRDVRQSEWRHHKKEMVMEMNLKQKMNDYLVYGM